jgi:squalene-associated FAD-dependent desaturase
LLAGLARLGTIGWRDRFSALRVGLALRALNGGRARLADITVREWLDGLGQSKRMQRRFWDLIALATLNELPELASADMFARVLEEAFLHTRRDSQMFISRVGLSDLYTHDARGFIEARGGEVLLNAEVERIEFSGNRASALITRDGDRLEGETVTSAATHQALARMLPPEISARYDCFRQLEQIKNSPIVSINLWFDEPVTELEFVGLLDSRIEWVFNKNAIAGHSSKTQHLALVISGAHEAAKLPKDKLIELAVDEIRRFFPAAHRARLVHSFVVREYDATISHTVGVARLRPSLRTPLENFFIAGDWTDTGLPATIEGAVRSGRN